MSRPDVAGDTSLTLAGEAAVRVKNRDAAIRNGFIEAATGSDVDAPLAVMMRGGQGGEARLKLMLSLLWVSGLHPHDTSFPGRAWAGLINLPEPNTNGARRISAAVATLEAQKLVRVERHDGLPPTVFVKDERGIDKDYEHPGAVIAARKGTEETTESSEYYVKLPPEFWTKGWIGVLSAPAVAMWLVLLRQAGRTGSTTGLWFSQKDALRRFGLSPDTRSAGFQELTERGLVSVARRSVSLTSFDYKKVRNVYSLHRGQLLAGPGQPPMADDDDVQLVAPNDDEHVDADAASVSAAEPAAGPPTSVTGDASSTAAQAPAPF